MFDKHLPHLSFLEQNTESPPAAVLVFNSCDRGKQNNHFLLLLGFFLFKMPVSLYVFLHTFTLTVTSLSGPQPLAAPLTVQPLGVVLGSAQRWQAAQAAVDGGVSPGEVHGRGSVKLPTGGDEGGGVVEGVVGTPSHPADLIVDLCQICQLQRRKKEEDEVGDESGRLTV